jgi:hypothetical protein
MKKIIFWIVVIGLIYYFRHQIWDSAIFKPIRENELIGNVFNKVKDSVEDTLDEQKVADEIKTWVLKDGIKLPKDWTLAQKTIGTQNVTVVIPPNPNGPNDYIALAVKNENTSKLPAQHICKQAETTSTCLVGSNYETLKVFSVMTFGK